MKKVLIISDSDLHKDPRILVQIDALNNLYELSCAGRTHPGDFFKGNFFKMKRGSRITRFHLKNKLHICRKLKQFDKIHLCDNRVLSVIPELKKHSFDLILCNDIPSLPLTYTIKNKQTKVYLDAHEFTPEQNEGEKSFIAKKPYLDYLMEQFATKVDFGTTVCKSIGDKFTNDYNFYINEIVMNLPKHRNLIPQKTNPDRIRLIHHGIATPSRKLTNLVDIVQLLDDRFSLDFYIANKSDAAFDHLKEYAKTNKRVNFCEPVPTEKIPETLNKYDIGLYPLIPAVPNQKYALPNKFFEFIQARIAIAIWPSIEMKNILETYELGVVSKDYSVQQLAERINSLTSEDINIYKENSNKAANILHSDISKQQIIQGVKNCLNSPT